MSRFFLISADDKIIEVPPDKTVFIGRAPINHVALNDRTVSRTHATIAPSPKGPLLTDRGSANGTLLNGRAVKEAILNHHDVLSIGKFVFHVIRGAPEDAQKWILKRRGSPDSEQTLVLQNIQPLREAAVSGELATFNLIDLLQTLGEQGKSGALTLKQQNQVVGKIYYLNGSIVNAETAAGLKGKPAFFELMKTKSGNFDFQATAKPPGIAIMEKPQALILEGCRLMDEQAAQ
jgi:pSer/pThr/pTyr-binding forkhead associated (FHA) protein